MNCPATHTVPDIPIEDWKCPECGAKNHEGFLIAESDPKAGDECEALHNKDEIRCYQCKFTATGEHYANWHRKQKKLVVCPCCDGTGVMQEGEPLPQ